MTKYSLILFDSFVMISFLFLHCRCKIVKICILYNFEVRLLVAPEVSPGLCVTFKVKMIWYGSKESNEFPISQPCVQNIQSLLCTLHLDSKTTRSTTVNTLGIWHCFKFWKGKGKKPQTWSFYSKHNFGYISKTVAIESLCC